MEMPLRRYRTAQDPDQENIYAKGKLNAFLPTKRQGLTIRGALDELNTNVQAQRDVNVGKLTSGTTDKKVTRVAVKTCNYSHVQSKVDTGLTNFNKTKLPSSRVPLRREESTAALATRAAIQKAALKDVQNDPKRIKDSTNTYMQTKKNVDNSKIIKPSWGISKDSNKITKPILKDPAEFLDKLKLSEIKNVKSKERKNETKCAQLSIPDDIEDIDADDDGSPILMTVYIKDIYKYLTKLEEKYPIEYDYLSKQSMITSKMRATLIDWLVDVHQQFQLLLETFQLAVGIIDRYLQVVIDVRRDELQLIGVTAMFIASKYEEVYPPVIDDFVHVTANAYTKADVLKCEVKVLRQLGFCLARPIPLTFCRRFIKAAKGTAKNHHLAKYFIDLCIFEYKMVHYRPSELAASAICLSLYVLSSKTLKEVWTPTLSYYSGYTLEHIDPIIRKMAKVVMNVENSNFQAVYTKYTSPHLAKVSTLPQLKGLAISDLANTPTS